MKKVDSTINKMNDQKYAMNKILEKSIERKQNYVKFQYTKASFIIDETLRFLLDKIAEIDGGKKAEEYLKSNQYYQGTLN